MASPRTDLAFGCDRWYAHGMISSLPPLSLLVSVLAFSSTKAAERVQTLDPARVRTIASEASRVPDGDQSILRVRTQHPTQERFPGVQLTRTAREWDLSAYGQIEFTLRNLGDTPITLHCRADSPTLVPDGVRHSVTGSSAVDPGKTTTLILPLRRLEMRVPQEELFGMWALPEEAFGDARGRVDAARINRLHVFVIGPDRAHSFEILDIRAAGEASPPGNTKHDSFWPMIDRYGQFIHRDWPGKIKSDEAMQAQIAREAEDLAAHPKPADRDEYGGWRDGPQLGATGFFRTTHRDGRWWLVTPEGRLFWANAINAVGEHDYTPIDDRNDWFADALWGQDAFKPFLRKAPIPIVRGHYKDRQPMTFSFHQANLLRKYGPDWRATYADLAHRRLASWGLNAIGVWSDRDIIRHAEHRTPYFAIVSSSRAPRIAGSSGWWLKFPDPFHPEFKQRIVDEMKRLQLQGITDDPWCIGFFVDNELTWKHDTYLAEATLQSPPDQPAKRELVNDLKHRYVSIDALNEAWATDHASWEALLTHQDLPRNKEGAADDLRRFYARVAEAYFNGSRGAVKHVSPNHLYLGCRFPYQVNRLVTDAAKQHCDVMSVNWYQYTVEGFEVPGGIDLPLIIGEFHFGALDRGMFHTGLKAVPDQAARAAAYERYVNSALKHPNIVGATWFKFSDEPNTGRWLDTENYQIGFLDVCDTPYPETITAARTVGRRLYQGQNHLTIATPRSTDSR